MPNSLYLYHTLYENSFYTKTDIWRGSYIWLVFLLIDLQCMEDKVYLNVIWAQVVKTGRQWYKIHYPNFWRFCQKNVSSFNKTRDCRSEIFYRYSTRISKQYKEEDLSTLAPNELCRLHLFLYFNILSILFTDIWIDYFAHLELNYYDVTNRQKGSNDFGKCRNDKHFV